MKVTKKVDELDAVQWRPGKTIAGVEIEYFTQPEVILEPGPRHMEIYYGAGVDCLRAYLVTEDARIRVCNGDWIITDAQGKKSVCPKAEFDKRYQAVAWGYPVEGEVVTGGKNMIYFDAPSELIDFLNNSCE